MLSIVIPTLNEENYLPFLLKSLREQKFHGDYELIVSDAGSEDGTVKIAESFGVKIAKGGFPGRGKNEGAKLAIGDLILFVDADVILPEDFLEKNLKEFQSRKLGVASFYLQSKNKIHNFLFHILFNFPSRITEKILPQAMNVILIKKDIHQRIGGFNEEIKLGEELDYIRRGKFFGNFGVLKSVKVFASARRYQQDGWFKTWSKYFLCQIYMFFWGPVKSDIFKYKFNHYKRKT